MHSPSLRRRPSRRRRSHTLPAGLQGLAWLLVLALFVLNLPIHAFASTNEERVLNVAKPLDRAQEYFLRIQEPDGSWVGEYRHGNWREQALLPWHVLFLDYMGVDSAVKRREVRKIAASQKADGDFGSPAFNFGAILVLEHAGGYARQVERANRFVAGRGQRLERAPLWIKMWWAMDGRLPWSSIEIPSTGGSLKDAWKTKPSWYIVSKLDGAIAPDEERFFRKRMKATTTELNTSHVPMLSKPNDVAAVIMNAAAKAPH